MYWTHIFLIDIGLSIGYDIQCFSPHCTAPMKPPASKRLDLQGIRGLAILSVLGFHFFPQRFPNGYLGVDQFFVLSGFLMCMLLTKSKNLPFSTLLTEFYTKRFRRILPLFYFVILLSMFELNTVYPVSEITNNENSAAKAIVFMSNRERSEDENYFKLLSAGTDLFLHTWSLSVEFQFYFIVPFLFAIGELLTGKLKHLYYFLLSALSLCFHSLSPAGVAFNSVFARIWQFLIGAGVYMLSGNMPSSKGYSLLDDINIKPDQAEQNEGGLLTYRIALKYTCLFASVTVAFWPIELLSGGWRPFFTVITGVLMAVSTDDMLLSNRVLNYIGDISYALYLVHWPIYEYLSALKMTDDTGLLLACLIASAIIAALLHETFEKWYLSLSNFNVSVLTVCLLAAIVAMIQIDEIKDALFPLYRDTTRLDGFNENLTIDDAESYNNLWSRRDLDGLMETEMTSRSLENDRWCDYKGEEGPYKIAIFGNSYARNHMRMVIQECKHKAYNITADAEKGCEPLSPVPETCQKSLDNFEKFVESAKPDYGFLLTRFFSMGLPFENENAPDLENDTVYLRMRSQLKKFLPNIKKRLFILDAIPKVDPFYLPNIVRDLKAGKTEKEVNEKLVHDIASCERARFRHAALVKECGEKCQLIDYYPLLFDKKTNHFRYFDDKGFSYFTIQLHMSPHGMELVRPIYRDICSKL